ncbi:extracellular solute-binding protein [Pararhizobium mangrovi]|uniref:Extracellular solute-binding protein n=2 Tax=Pararhizobium mangrovi TaxID=2590452 RepID=A0A506U3S5_9HYPH|nr:extracellular solute-binding protein [Pararhizobium mangrovi]
MRAAALAAFGFIATAGTAYAGCGIDQGSVRILSNDFDALGIIIDAAKECAGDGVTVSANMTTEHKSLQVPALSVNPARYTVATIANNSIAPLLTKDLIRPLDEYVKKWGGELDDRQLIRVDGKVVAIAFMINSQHLFMRKDVLEEASIKEPPKTYAEILAAAKKIRDKGIMKYPLAATDQAGWYLATEFVNIYLATGGDFFKPGSAEPAIDNKDGLETLKTMKALTQYMAPNYMSVSADEMKNMYLSGNVAIMNQWGSMVEAHTDPKGPAPKIAANTILDPAPTLKGHDIPASALWWDGFAIAKNISDKDAEASFQAMMHALRPQVAEDHPKASVWLAKGFNAPKSAQGILKTASGGARPYPMSPYMGLMHTALGNELSDFMQGNESAEKALKDVSAAYRTAARETGFLQ